MEAMSVTEHEAETDTGSDDALPEPADHERSGADVVEAVETAAEGTPHDGVQIAPEDAKPHTAPVEQVRDDPAMTEGPPD